MSSRLASKRIRLSTVDNKTWVIADTHFSHDAIIQYGGRPFLSVEGLMIRNWNALVQPHDLIYHLGDVTLKRAQLGLVKLLHGQKRLILGNHDIYDVKDYLEAGFQQVMASRELDGCLLTHLPIHPRSVARWRANIHGHIHQHDYGLPYINVCVERTDYKPVLLADLTRDLPPKLTRAQYDGISI